MAMVRLMEAISRMNDGKTNERIKGEERYLA
jgi:hypothetical protein